MGLLVHAGSIAGAGSVVVDFKGKLDLPHLGEDFAFARCGICARRNLAGVRLFLMRLNRLTLCFSKKLRNLEAAFGLFAAWYNYCWQTRKPGKSGQKRPTAAMMAGIAGHVWSFDELFDAVLAW